MRTSQADHHKDELFVRKLVERLVEERTQQSVTLRQIGQAIGYDFSYLSKAERGLTQPGLITLLKWFRALGLDFVDISIEIREALSKD